MYKAIIHRYGKPYIKLSERIDDLISSCEYLEDYGHGFVECYLDENNIILSDDSLQNVIGIRYNSRVGEHYDISDIENI